ncbi:MAG: hypothetical protein PHW77_07835 [Eubacteriales bacterium]|nr:hypothetical protein [Eubacteriales bacterium]
MKKLICLLLSVLLAATLFVACSEPPEDTSSESSKAVESNESEITEESDTTSTDDSTDPYTNDDGRYINSNEIIDWGGREFSIIVRGTAAATYQSDDFTTGSELYGELLDTAVTNRNNTIEQMYNVKLKIYKSDAVGSDPILSNIRDDITGSTTLYDAIMPTIPALAALAKEGNLIDLGTLDYIHLDAPWYDANATNTFSIGYQYFFTTGDITILNKVCSGGMLFSKEIIATRGLDDPYELVRNHEWTYDKMKQMAKEATKDTDGIDGMTGADTWGMLSSHADALGFYGAAGQLLCKKNANDYPYLAFGDETTMTIAQKIINDMIEENTWIVYAQDFEEPIWVTSLDAFKEGRVLFRPSAFSATTKLRIAGTDFGIVPMPLWSTEQDDYCTFCGTGETAGIAISIGCADEEFSAYMIEAISCESKNFITPAYVEINLKGKDMQDEDSLEMLNLIFGNIIYDTGDVYRFGSINTLFTNLVAAKKSNLASTFESQKGAIEDAIESLIDSYNAG